MNHHPHNPDDSDGPDRLDGLARRAVTAPPTRIPGLATLRQRVAQRRRRRAMARLAAVPAAVVLAVAGWAITAQDDTTQLTTAAEPAAGVDDSEAVESEAERAPDPEQDDTVTAGQDDTVTAGQAQEPAAPGEPTAAAASSETTAAGRSASASDEPASDEQAAASQPQQTMVAVPDLVGLTRSAAEARLRELGLRPMGDPFGAGQMVAWQYPAAGAQVDSGEIVEFRPGVVMPDLAGLTRAEADATLRSLLGMDYSRGTTETSDRASDGMVASQRPAAGTLVDLVDSINIVHFSYFDFVPPPPPSRVAVPDLMGLTRSAAEARLRELGLRPMGDPFGAGQMVAWQYPAAGAQVDSGEIVEFRPGVVMPDLAGLTRAEADATLRSLLGMDYSRGTTETSDRASDGMVASQRPAAGTLVDLVDSINIVHFSYFDFVGPPVEMPDVAGMTLSDAEDALGRLGLVVKIKTTETSDPAKVGLVRSSVPRRGTLVDHGAVVGIRYYVLREG